MSSTVVETQTLREMGVAVTQQQTVQGKVSLLPTAHASVGIADKAVITPGNWIGTIEYTIQGWSSADGRTLTGTDQHFWKSGQGRKIQTIVDILNLMLANIWSSILIL